MSTCPHLRSFAIATAYGMVSAESASQKQREAIERAQFDPKLAALLQHGQLIVVPEVTVEAVQAQLDGEVLTAICACNGEDCGHWNNDHECCGESL